MFDGSAPVTVSHGFLLSRRFHHENIDCFESRVLTLHISRTNNSGIVSTLSVPSHVFAVIVIESPRKRPSVNSLCRHTELFPLAWSRWPWWLSRHRKIFARHWPATPSTVQERLPPRHSSSHVPKVFVTTLTVSMFDSHHGLRNRRPL